MPFTPKHPQPFTFAACCEWSVDELLAEIQRLQNSIAHLESTVEQLLGALAEEEDADFRAAVDEDRAVLASQRERVEMMRAALVDKIGEDGVRHLGLEAGARGAGQTGAIVGMPGDERASRGPERQGGNQRMDADATRGEEDGVFL
ncbi:hypothetical protein Q5752_002985 [Cryptotrichosporon argae]